MNWSRRLALAFGVVVALLVPHPGDGWPDAHAAGCYNNGSWSQTAYHAVSFTDPFGQNGSTDMTVWHDGCGHKQARYSIWSSTGSTLSSDGTNNTVPVLAMRQWTCGYQDFGQAQNVAHNGGVMWSGWYNENGCGDQWDNAFVVSSSTRFCTSAACHDAGQSWPTKPYLSEPCNQYNC